MTDADARPRLSTASLDGLAPDVARPGYDRAATGVGMVHLGIGAFHRAHQAAYTEDVLTAAGGDWAIRGVSLRSPTVRDQLAPQDGLYTLVERDDSGDRRRVIGAVKDVLVAPEAPAAVVEALADPGLRVVTLTVTEKGYCHDPATGALKLDHPAIARDLASPERPTTAAGFLTAALRARRAAGVAPFTVVCCDNLPDNGRVVRGTLLSFAERVDPALADWIAEQVPCPGTMVDRIVPATTPEDIEGLAASLGVVDHGMVKAEPFSQWVIEDRFANGRPAWERAGAMLVDDVTPFEDAKLRLLNGSHSALAYLGYLAGCTYVHEAMAIPALARFVDRLMAQESAPSLTAPPGLDLNAYQADLKARFANSALGHRTYQIAMDGSQKLPQRLLNTVRVQLQRGGPIAALSLAVAAWMRYVTGRDEQGRPIEVQDPLAGRLAAVARQAGGDAQALARGYLAVAEVFGDDLGDRPRFVTAVTEGLDHLLSDGARATVERFMDGAAMPGAASAG